MGRTDFFTGEMMSRVSTSGRSWNSPAKKSFCLRAGRRPRTG
jgi:hypothetical protein